MNDRDAAAFYFSAATALLGLFALIVALFVPLLRKAKAVKVSPGDHVKDKISGAEGIVTCRSEWQYGCVRLTIQPREQKEGKPVDPFVIDEAQAEVLKAQAVPDSRYAEATRPHGDRPAASRQAEPTR
jgi:hypothetical protein